MTHIVFNEPDVAVLKKAIELDETLQGEVFQVKDEYAVGPIADIYQQEGIAARRSWWEEVLAGGDYAIKDENTVNDNQVVEELVNKMRGSEEVIWIWAAQNKHDVSGYYWLLPFMKEFQGRVFILYLNNLPFINEKGNIFYPDWLSEIQPREFLKAKKLAREITPSEFEVDPDEWTKLCQENRGVRLLEGGKKLVQAGYDFYDEELLKYVTSDWQKGSKVIHHFLSKAKNTTGDAYLLWRLKVLAALEKFDVQGKLENMKDFEIKVKSEVAV